MLSDARGEVQRGLEVVEFACGIPTLLKGDYSDQVSAGVDTFSFRQPLGVVRRHHAVQLPGDGADVDVSRSRSRAATRSCSSPASATRRRRCSSPSCGAEAGLPDGVFNVVHGDKVAVDALLDHPRVAAVSFVGSTPIARYIHERGSGDRQAGAGARRREEPRDRAARRRPRLRRRPPGGGRLRLGRRAVHGDLGGGRGRRRRRRARRGGRRPRRRGGQGRPRPRRAPARWVRSSPREARDRIVGLDRRGRDAGRQRARSTAAASSCRATRTASSSARRCSTRCTTDDGRLHRGDLRPGAVGAAGRRRRRGDRADQRQPLRQRHGDLHLERRGGAAVPARGERRHDRHQRARSRCRWPTTPSAAGRTRCSATRTSTAPRACRFYTRAKVVTARWPHVAADAERELPLPDVAVGGRVRDAHCRPPPPGARSFATFAGDTPRVLPPNVANDLGDGGRS